jgi:hypothetical protein
MGKKSSPDKSTTAQQGAAPDRLQLHSFRSFLTSLIPLPAAGELGVRPSRQLYGKRKEYIFCNTFKWEWF